MHFYTILAFAFLFWRAESPTSPSLLFSENVALTLMFAAAQPVLAAFAAFICVRRIRKMLQGDSADTSAGHLLYQRAFAALRVFLTAGFGVTTLATDWPLWFAWGRVAPVLQIFGDLIVLSPFVVGSVLLWIISYPLERQLRGFDEGSVATVEGESAENWRMSAFLDFQIRHHLLVVAAPMLLILFASNLIRARESSLQWWSGFAWAPDALLGLAAGAVFLLAPFLLRRLWRTTPLEPGPLRDRLEAMCRRIGLRCREILVWKSDGLMINAAVMGVFPGVRYVLLSDALLASMTARQIEAVFGHEAGHVRHRHIQHFLLFAFVGWIAAGAAMEITSWCFANDGEAHTALVSVIQGVGLGVVFALWMLGFGWLSRRFERQADLHGARCVTPEVADCSLPCSVHLDNVVNGSAERVCASAAELFASALERVALLSGIPREERSWRHSSVGSRIRFLRSLAADPARAVQFERVVRRVKKTTLAAALIGSGATIFYLSTAQSPSFLRAPTQRASAHLARIPKEPRTGDTHADHNE